MPHSERDRSPVRQLRSLCRHPRSNGNLRHPVRTCLELFSPLCRLLHVLLQLQNPRRAWAQPSNRVRTLTRARPPSAEPSALRQVKHRGWYFPQKTPRRSQGSSRCRRDPRKAKGPPRTAAMPGAIPHSVLPTVLIHCTPLIRGKTTTPEISRTCNRPSLCL